MNISFKKLSEADFPLLLRWLEKSHVKAWWDQEILWTRKLIQEKYANYVEGYKNENGRNKPIYAYVIYVNDVPVGYIQYYDVQDFANEYQDVIQKFSEKCASFDWYIGEEEYLGKGLGKKILECFLDEHIFQNFDNCCVVSEKINKAALRVYEKCGFKVIDEIGEQFVLMKKKK